MKSSTLTADPILDDRDYLRTLCFRLERAELRPERISPDERASVLREARRVIEGFRERAQTC